MSRWRSDFSGASERLSRAIAAAYEEAFVFGSYGHYAAVGVREAESVMLLNREADAFERAAVILKRDGAKRKKGKRAMKKPKGKGGKKGC